MNYISNFGFVYDSIQGKFCSNQELGSDCWACACVCAVQAEPPDHDIDQTCLLMVGLSYPAETEAEAIL